MSKKQFKAESKRLLELMINSIYTNKEIFLREIISNASDAEDKLCYKSLTDDKVGLSREDFVIQLEINKELRSLTVTDNGIGMTKEELEANLGTIARSGSLQFKNEMESREDIDIIGQFGVGFYSAFMVASNVTVVSRAYGSDEAWCWQSSGADGYTLTPCKRDTWGTTVVMRIKDDTEEDKFSQYLTEDEITMLVRKYSDYIRYPVKLELERSETEKDAEGKDQTVTTRENTVLNSMVPVWQKPKKDVSPEEYDNFYAEKFGAYDKPALTIPVSAEGLVSFKALLFVPGEIPFDFYSRDFAPGVQLYSSGVLIMDKCADLVPEHFRFIRGVVDTQDVSLNISREMLQHNRQLKVIASSIDKKVRGELLKLQEENREDYEKFFANFGMQLKYGTMNDYGKNKDALKDLLLFYSSAEKKLTTLKEYVARMPESQKYIFYAAGEDAGRIDRMPQTEAFKAKGYEILYLTESIDEMVLQIINEYGEKKFRSVDDESALEQEDTPAEDASHAKTMEFVKETLGERIAKARISRKLVSSPVCMAADGGMSFEMEKYFETLCKKTGEQVIRAQRVLEFNPEHKVLSTLEKTIEEDPEKAKKLVELLYCQSVLTAGLPLEDPREYGDLVCDLIF